MALEETVRVAAPDGLVAEVDGPSGRRYRATGGGMYDMLPRDAAALLREGGFKPSIGGVTRGGYVCPCGFRPVVRTCSRCGGRAETTAERAERIAAELASRRGPLEPPMAIATRPQDWAEPARSIIFGPEREMGGLVRAVQRAQAMRPLTGRA